MNLKKTCLILLTLGCASGWLLLRSRAAPQTSAAAGPPAVTLFITLGNNASSVEKWDGSVRVTGGELASLTGWHFSADDAVSGRDSWSATTRRDAVAPYADMHYTEMRPGSQPPVLFHPAGIYATVRASADARVAVHTAQGDFDFALSQTSDAPLAMLGGRATVVRVPTSEKLTGAEYEDDDPAIAALPDGGVAVAWVAYKDRADRVLLRENHAGAWTAAQEVTPAPVDIFRCSLAVDGSGSLWAFWNQRDGDTWHLYGRQRSGSGWGAAEKIGGAGTDTFHRAASGADGTVAVVWSSFRGGQSDIFLRVHGKGGWMPEVKLSESPANDWEPSLAVGPDGTAYAAWDTYDRGNYDVMFRSWRAGTLSPLRRVTASPRFQAHTAVTVDPQGRPWIAWDETGVNWGKDQGFLIPTPFATPLHRERSIVLATWDGKQWLAPKAPFPPSMRDNAEHPQMAFDGGGSLVMLFRHWTRHNDRTIGSPIDWEDYLTRLDGERWTTPVPLEHSQGSIEKYAAMTRTRDGEIRAAWMTDGRPFATQKPVKGDIYYASLGSGGTARFAAAGFERYAEPFAEAIPIHNRESDDVKAMRAYRLAAAGKQYAVYRGDMHRHSDVSQDFKYDGSLLEIYRYAIDAAAFDYIAITDHQAGYDQEFTWWQNQILVDLFQVAGAFTPLYAYERSVAFPNGHRNVIFDHRGVRTLPIPPAEQRGDAGAAKLYEYLRQNNGITMPHSSATSQGTDWRDNGGELEPLIEIYQGYRTSYEYEGAPRAATANNPQVQKSGWQPEGFWWNALAKGYKLGVQSSSDHWSTHISYACLLAEKFTREGLVDAIRKRHAYGATDNIVLEFRASAGGVEHIMGDVFTASASPRFTVRVQGTGTIKQVDVIRNGKFIYTARPGEKQARFELTDREFPSGESWYYTRVLQEDGQLAWSSPMWVSKK
jgi:hypothetical protein